MHRELVVVHAEVDGRLPREHHVGRERHEALGREVEQAVAHGYDVRVGAGREERPAFQSGLSVGCRESACYADRSLYREP